MGAGDRVGVAVSGGTDSVALLRLLLDLRAELGIVLSVVHFNHKIRGAEAEADEEFVRNLARRFELEFHADSDDTPAYAQEHKLSLEAAGRTLRYAFFDRLTADSTVHRVATAHTRDDQAETVLMRFLRGAGTKGLAGIYPGMGGWISDGRTPVLRGPRIVRPLLQVAREELRKYLRDAGQDWREDASNLDVNFTRNRVRHEIMAALRPVNPNLDEVLAEMAEIARAEEGWWNSQLDQQQDVWAQRPNEAARGVFVPPRMQVDVLLAKPVAMQRRLIRRMVEFPEAHLDFQHVEAVLALAASPASRAERVLELPNGFEAVRQDRELWFRRKERSRQGHAYSLGLPVPGEWEVVGRKIRASITRDVSPRPEAGPYIRAALLGSELKRQLCVRNWHAGDRYQPAHTKEPKKLKELLQARHIPREQKPYWPVVVSGEEIVWVPGFEAPERFRVREGQREGLLLEEVPLEGEKGT